MSGEAFCSGDPFAFSLQAEPRDEDPVVTFTVPDEAALGDATAILMLGVICPDGTPVLDLAARDVRCDGSDEPRTLAQFTIQLASDDAEPNRSPVIPADAFTFDDAAWPAPTAAHPATGCADGAGTDELPLRSVGAADVAAPVIGITGDDASRETFIGPGDVERREDLVYQVFASLGEPDRLYTVLDDDTTEDTLEWALPTADQVDASGTLVHFWLVLLDQRGGTAWTERQACVIP